MMAIKSGYVYLKGVSFHAFHGVLPQESLVGADYKLDLRVGYPIEQAMESDNVEATLNYAVLYELAQQEMQKPSPVVIAMFRATSSSRSGTSSSGGRTVASWETSFCATSRRTIFAASGGEATSRACVTASRWRCGSTCSPAR